MPGLLAHLLPTQSRRHEAQPGNLTTEEQRVVQFNVVRLIVLVIGEIVHIPCSDSSFSDEDLAPRLGAGRRLRHG